MGVTRKKEKFGLRGYALIRSQACIYGGGEMAKASRPLGRGGALNWCPLSAQSAAGQLSLCDENGASIPCFKSDDGVIVWPYLCTVSLDEFLAQPVNDSAEC